MRRLKLFVINKIPRRIRNTPPIIDTHFKYFEIFSMYFVAREKAMEIRRNGIARPAENTVNSNAP